MKLDYLTDEEVKKVEEILEITKTNVEHDGNFYSSYGLRVLMFDLLFDYRQKEEELERLQKELEKANEEKQKKDF